MQERVLTALWASRYTTDLSAFPLHVRQEAIMQLVAISSPEGRHETVEQLKQSLQINCERAGMQTSELLSYIPNVVNLNDVQRVAASATQLYKQTIGFYEQDSLPLSSFVLMPSIGLQAIEQLSKALEPNLQDLRTQHLAAKDPRAIGFLSTQFHFSTQFLLNRLTSAEQMLLSPYFRFLEEQVCIPWQRLCDAAIKHSVESPSLTLVRQMLPQSKDIAKSVFRHIVQLNPGHQSRRGTLNNPGVTASTIRDVQMFQGYLWLCLLEGSVASVEEELVPLCVMVFPAIGVTWELVHQATKMLIEELKSRMQPKQIELLHPYARSMQYFFAELCG